MNSLKILSFCVCFTVAQALGQGPGPGHAEAHPNPVERPSSHLNGKGSRKQHTHAEHGKSDGTPANSAAQPIPPHNALQFGPVGRWWDDKSVVANIGLSHQQQRRMDSIFNANRASIVSSYKEFLKAQSHLETVNKDPKPDQSQVFAAIDHVNQARSELQKATSAMLLQIRQEMSPEQIEKLKKLR